MKARNAFLLLSSAVLLCGCGPQKIKAPKKLVSYNEFSDTLNNILRNNTMLDTSERTSTYSFVLDASERHENISTETARANGKEVGKTKSVITVDGTLKFDASSKIMDMDYNEKEDKSDISSTSSSERKGKIHMQTDYDAAVVINKNKKIYSLTKWDDPAGRMDMAARKLIRQGIYLFGDNIEAKNAEYYIDGDMYTYITKSSNSSDDYSSESMHKYQLIVKDNSATVITDYVHTSISYYDKTTVTNESHEQFSITLTRKDVSLKKLSLSNYTEVRNVSIDFLIF